MGKPKGGALCHRQKSGIRKMLWQLLTVGHTVPAVILGPGSPFRMAGPGAMSRLLDPRE